MAGPPTIAPVLSVRDLIIEFPGPRGPVRAVNGVLFDLWPNEVFGVVGESGSGKSLTMLAVMGLLPNLARLTSGEIRLHGRNLVGAPAEALRQIRGRDLAMIFQDPMMALNPVLRVGGQIAEIIGLHQPHRSKPWIRDRVVELLGIVGIPDPERRMRQYPHQFSGGMRQRAMIAMAIANDPAVLIADEPTTALDVTIQAQVLQVLAEVRARTGAAMILVTHDLGVIAETADRVGVMYCGRIIEQGGVEALFRQPRHPYTAGLLASLPRLDRPAEVLYSIPGTPPGLLAQPTGCAFHPRCGLRHDRDRCTTEVPALRPLGPSHLTACHFAEETVPEGLVQPRAAEPAPAVTAAEPLLRVEHLAKHFPLGNALGWHQQTLRAVEDVSFSIARGETLGLVGESGCGKSTLGRTIIGLYPATSGSVVLDGIDLTRLRRRERRRYRQVMQVVFQDPFASLDPRMTVEAIIAEPLRINGVYRPGRVAELLESVGLRPEMRRQLPAAFSGGQRQRIGIARALALDPRLLVLDEPVSALDVSIQAQVINLLARLQRERGLSYLLIAHDLAIVRHAAQRVAVMYLGRIVETGTREQMFASPTHPYTQSLLSAVPRPDPRGRGQRARIVLRGDLPNPADPPSGCGFRTRCFKAQPVCAGRQPMLQPFPGQPGHFTACHFAAADATPSDASSQTATVQQTGSE